MDEITVRSEQRNCEYLVSEDTLDLVDCNGKEQTETVWAVSVRNDGMEDYEFIKSFKTKEEAVKFAQDDADGYCENLFDGYRYVRELDRRQLVQLKERYLCQLSDEGTLNAVLYGRPEDDEDENLAGVSYEQMVNADKLVPDDIVFDHWEGTMFTAEDFC